MLVLLWQPSRIGVDLNACPTHTRSTCKHTRTQRWGKYGWHRTERANICFAGGRERFGFSVSSFCFWGPPPRHLTPRPPPLLISTLPFRHSIFHCIIIVQLLLLLISGTYLHTRLYYWHVRNAAHPPYHLNTLNCVCLLYFLKAKWFTVFTM